MTAIARCTMLSNDLDWRMTDARRIGAVILAAGASTRLGRPKQIEPLRGTTLLARTMDAAEGAGCTPIVVVLGAHADRVRPELEGRSVTPVVHSHWKDGLGSSIRCGIQTLRQTAELDGALLLVCDQAAIDASILKRLCAVFDRSPGQRVAATYGATTGVPALFERSLFDDLERLEGDRGARSVLLADPRRLYTVPWPAGALDIDTEDDVNAS